MNNWILIGASSCALCVLIGAFGAHGLKNLLNEYAKNIYQTANIYHFFHSIGLIINGLLAKSFLELNFNYSYLLITKKTILDDQYENIKKAIFIDFKKIK